MWITLSKQEQGRTRANNLSLSVEKRGLSIRLNDEIAEAMQWSHGTRLGVKLGTEEDQGKLALYADPHQGWRLQHAGSSSRKLRLMLGGAPIPGMPDRLPAAAAEYQIDLDAKQVIVTLPWDKPRPLRGVQNAETGRFAHACPDLDQEPAAVWPAAAVLQVPHSFPQQDKTMAEVAVTRVTSPPPADTAPPPISTSMTDVVTFLRREGDAVVKSTKPGEWHLNGTKSVDAKHLLDRANRIRKRKREPEMRIA